MIDNSCRHHRRSTRLRGYDYTQPGAYFVTVCTQERTCWFGEVVDGEMQPNALGKIACEEWFKSADVRPNVALHQDEFVVMPNHIHGIIWIVGDDGAVVGAQRRCAPTDNTPTNVIPGSLGAMSVRSNPPSPNASTHNVGHPARPSGNAIITNTSSATRNR